MSFILDALKKSEIERQRQSVPGLMDTRSGLRRNRLPVWAIALGVLLGINLLVLTFVLTRKSAPTAQASQQAAAASAPEAAAPPETHFSPLDTAPVYAPEIPVASGEAAAPLQPPTVRRASAGGAGIGAVRAAHRPDPLLSDGDSKADQEILPSINEINMRKYHEGARLQEGPTVEHIRRDGVVLNYQGLRFILPRQP
jgi:general secretion pathway protein B